MKCERKEERAALQSERRSTTPMLMAVSGSSRRNHLNFNQLLVSRLWMLLQICNRIRQIVDCWMWYQRTGGELYLDYTKKHNLKTESDVRNFSMETTADKQGRYPVATMTECNALLQRHRPIDPISISCKPHASKSMARGTPALWCTWVMLYWSRPTLLKVLDWAVRMWVSNVAANSPHSVDGEGHYWRGLNTAST
jgi:hypothetical protein